MTPYTLPEPDYRRLSDLQSGIDNWYSPATLRSEVERIHRETVEECAKVCEDGAWRLKDLAVSTKSEATNSRAIQASLCADAIREILK